MSPAWLRAAISSQARELEDLAEMMNTPLPVRRRVAFISVTGGCGATTLASEVSRILVRQWTRRLLLVTAADPQSTRYRWPPTVRSLPADCWNDPLGHWDEAVSDAHLSHDLTITDWGAAPLVQLRSLAEHAHALCLVTPARRKLIQSTLDVGWELSKKHPVRLAIVDIAGDVGPALDTLARALPLPTTLLHHNRHLARNPQAAPKLSEPDALTVYKLAAGLIRDLTQPRPERAA